MAGEGEFTHDISSLLFTSDRDYLVRNNGDKVTIDWLKGKTIGVYFSASWCGPCHRFTPALAGVYNELVGVENFEIVFVTSDHDDESFNMYFSTMPWLAIPFNDSETRDRLDEIFKVNGIPHLVFLSETGEVLTEEGYDIIGNYGSSAFPFSKERIQELKEQDEEAKRNQSLKSILVTNVRDYVLASDGRKVPVSDLEGKTVGIYLSLSSYNTSATFTQKLIQVYEDLKGKGENFEIVTIPLDKDDESFQKFLSGIPWLSLPLNDKKCSMLVRYFELSDLPSLVIIGPDGKTLHANAAEAVDDHGALVYPFSAKKFSELEEIQKAKEAAQTLESLLVSGDNDFVIRNDGSKVPVVSLVGKNVLLYFSAKWCPPCRAFLPKLIKAYNKIKAKTDALEVIFISSDEDVSAFDEFFAEMPWLALPFGDDRKAALSRTFKERGIPKLVALGPTGRTVTKDARKLVELHGADAYPFTEERLKEMSEKWPQKLKHELHADHELALTHGRTYICGSCDEEGGAWSFHCGECDFDLHPECAMEDESEDTAEGDKEG